jgi:hypothetical protein
VLCASIKVEAVAGAPGHQPNRVRFIMYLTTISLHEYRMRYPGSAAIPTLTQSGFLGLLLERQRLRAKRLLRRHAKWQLFRAAPRIAWVRFWQAFAGPSLSSPSPHPSVRVDVATTPLT